MKLREQAIIALLLCCSGPLCPAQISGHKLIKDLKMFVSIPSITGHHDACKKIIDHVIEELSELPVIVTRYRHNGFHAATITTRHQKKAKLWLVCHVDVVAGAPFALTEGKGKFFGRGVADMKMALPIFIQIFRELGDNLRAYDIGLMLTSDEENGGSDGTGYLLKHEGITGQYAFLPDGGYGWAFETENKGSLGVQLMAQGKAAHYSRPWDGVNAIEMLNDAYTAIKQALARRKKDTSFFSTATVTHLSGGDNPVSIPDRASAFITMGIAGKTDSLSDIETILSDVLKNFPAVTMRVLFKNSPCLIDVDAPEVKRFAALAKKRGMRVGLTRSHGVSDARFFYEHGINPIVIGPSCGNAHARDEWLDREDYLRYADVVLQWVKEGR